MTFGALVLKVPERYLQTKYLSPHCARMIVYEKETCLLLELSMQVFSFDFQIWFYRVTLFTTPHAIGLQNMHRPLHHAGETLVS